LHGIILCLESDGLRVLGCKESGLDPAVLEHHQARVVGLAHDAIRIEDVHEEVVNVAGGTVQVRSDVMPLAFELVAFGALIFKYRFASLERPRTFKKGSTHP